MSDDVFGLIYIAGAIWTVISLARCMWKDLATMNPFEVVLMSPLFAMWIVAWPLSIPVCLGLWALDVDTGKEYVRAFFGLRIGDGGTVI